MLDLDVIAELFAGEEAWVVGGAVRDELLGRDPPSTSTSPAASPSAPPARSLARAGDAVFPLNEQFGAWRVLLDRSRTVDFSPLRGGSIEDDLAARDFTVNAIARPVAGGEYVDPFGGRGDVERGVLRAVSRRRVRPRPAPAAARRPARGRARLPARSAGGGADAGEGRAARHGPRASGSSRSCGA